MSFSMSTPFYTIFTKTPPRLCRFLTGLGHVSSRQDYELLNPWATMLSWSMIILFWGMLDAIKASESRKKKKKGERESVTGIMMLFKCRPTHMRYLFADALVFSVCFEKYFWKYFFIDFTLCYWRYMWGTRVSVTIVVEN